MINIKENEHLNTLNHSCAHLLAQAVSHLYPNAKFWVGPVIEEGFYYDIDLGDDVIKTEDLEKIEKEMKKIAKDGKRIVRREISKEEALEMFKDDPYKIDLINRMDENETTISCYTQGDFTDLCRGPHVGTVKELKNFKLIKHSGAYWKNDAKNKMLQRIYGVCFDNKEDLEAYLKELEEAKERDHRKIGKDLEIFMTSPLVGAGMPLWLPNGSIVRKQLENYIYKKEQALGYDHVYTPCVGTKQLYVTSGHWDHYQKNMFPLMKVDDEEFVLRPMNCPHHMLVYKNKLHSYRDLPVRIGEFATDFRYEASGAVKGLERVRCMCQNDAHLFVTPEQIGEEFKRVVALILDVYKDFGIKDYKFRLSLRDKEDKEKYFDDDEMWDNAENKLREVLNELGVEYFEAKGEAAFYGPKLDVEVKPAVGPEVTLSTCQLDFLLPRRFELNYIDSNGEKQVPVVIHRAIFGTFDRFTAFIIEETKGAFPLWLAPSQIVIVPVNSEIHADYAYKVKESLASEGFRVEVDARNEKLGYRIREAQLKKIPVEIVVGDDEIAEGSVNIRRFGVQGNTSMKLEDAIALFKDEVKKFTC
ncbi:MAG: threonine--tRNA ligase [Erysipelotrichaceae bacterium]|nr:threonine--tRNA ligase [Solobacterium sp.]MDY2953424.1 threonine--tRNA ligase [Erysipelotrichaceae bacterium]MDY5277034.1 threonine--tRNA ligase [Erysipelotrichaceae bacterium]MDY5402291.1 threonine--tRNA ligase [Erysipelotrichaceae bacterium]